MTSVAGAPGVRPHARSSGRIGPNVILQTVAVIRERFGDAAAAGVLADTPWRLDRLPTGMVVEADVRSMVHATLRRFGDDAAHQVMDAAGVGTAHYLLANRIPKIAQVVMKLAPASVALRVLLTSIQRNSWTFAGNARFVVTYGTPTVVEFHDCAMCRGLHSSGTECQFYAATFRQLLTSLVSARTQVVESCCMAAGAACCRFTLEI